ncbi:hypothetical protein THAOC_09461, partial [Thalassiosira oceanica]
MNIGILDLRCLKPGKIPLGDCTPVARATDCDRVTAVTATRTTEQSCQVANRTPTAGETGRAATVRWGGSFWREDTLGIRQEDKTHHGRNAVVRRVQPADVAAGKNGRCNGPHRLA